MKLKKHPMMKKLLFSVLLFLAFAVTASAQCTPDSLCNDPGICPDSATNLPHAIAGTPYSTVMTAAIPHDTMGLPFDSVGVTSLTGLPSGFSYITNSASGYWPGGPIGGVNKGCLLITGNPTVGQIGTYPLTINIDAVVIGTHNPSTLTYYKIVIDPPSGVNEITPEQFMIMQNIPNPFAGETKIEFVSATAETYQLSVINIIGQEVLKKTIKAEVGKNCVDFSSSGLPSGIYLYKISNKSCSLTRRMNIEK